MHDKLKLLLDKIRLNEEYYSFFNNGKILKIIVNEKNKTWKFKIEIETNLPLEVYKEFNKLLPNMYEDINSIEANFNCKIIKESILKEYYIYFISLFNKKSFEVFKDNNIYIKDNNIIIECDNKAEEMRLNKNKDDFEELFNNSGFNLPVKTIINSINGLKTKEEIEKEKRAKTKIEKKENPIIFGEKITRRKNFDIRDIINEDNNIIIEGYVFDVEFFESNKNNFKIITIKIHDYTDSIYCKVFTQSDEEFENLKNKIKIDKWLKISGYSKNDIYSKDLVLNVRDINEIEIKEKKIEDKSKKKRVELHAHTFMSQMDSVIDPSKLIEVACEYGHSAIAVTDHNCVQAFPAIYNTSKRLKKKGKYIKIIYGAELNVVDDEIEVVIGETNTMIENTIYCVFDVETTGFNATSGDSLIEIGAVKILNGEIIDKFDELINPGKEIPERITSFTHITNDMVKDCRSEKEVVADFKKWIGNDILVAHNAKFDKSFLSSVYERYHLGSLNNVIIDTMQMSRILNPEEPRHNLSVVTKRYEVEFDEQSHHRADYDALATAKVLDRMLNKLLSRGIKSIKELNSLMTIDDVFKFGTMYHVTVLVKNNIGIKNLYKLISYANTKYEQKVPKILKSELEQLREGLLLGSSCANGEVFTRGRSVSDDELITLMRFYDFIEVQPLSNYDYLLQLGEFNNQIELKNHVNKIIDLGFKNDFIVVATSDCHCLTEKDKIYREIIINQKNPGGGLHPLKRKDITNIPSFHFRTTDEMIKEFSFLNNKETEKIVIENTNIISNMIEDNIKIIKDEKEPYTPIFEGSKEETIKIVDEKVKELYGDNIHPIIKTRIKEEMDSIITHGFDVIYLISRKLVKKSNDDGYIVGSRGSVGSSFVATLMGITEVNPLPPHYYCSKCKKVLFEKDGVYLDTLYSSGYDLPDLECECGNLMNKEGQDMPFATFFGIDGDKVPDIDLNFSGEYQSRAHDYTKEIFGKEYVYRAGTIGTVADRTAFGFVKGYLEEKNKVLRNAEIERLAKGCIGVKRTTGQHPGGIVVVPNYMDVFDFTPYQYPADDRDASWYTTHFEFSAIHDYILKLDILGHDDPTTLKMLQDITNVDINSIPFDDKKVLSIFSNTKELGATPAQIECEVGTLGVPEFGTNFVIDMLISTKPKTFGELVKISGLSHGTDVWLGNAKNLIDKKVIEFKDVIGCRDDIMIYLMHKGLEPINAFEIMEFVRKGKASFDLEIWSKYESLMIEKNIPEWYIESCRRIKYMFPKAHATAYVMMGYRVAYFKVYYPIHYYSSLFSIRFNDFCIDSMLKGYDAIKNKMIDIRNKGKDATNKEESILETLKCALEMTARGYTFKTVDLYKSDSKKFLIDDDNKSLIAPFRSLDGLGEVVANKILEEREKSKFISIEDLQNRCKVSQTIINKMRVMGILDNMSETNQLSLF